MIEDKKLGLKIAENKDEAFWSEMKTKIEKDIDMNKKNIEISEHILKLVANKLKK